MIMIKALSPQVHFQYKAKEVTIKGLFVLNFYKNNFKKTNTEKLILKELTLKNYLYFEMMF